MSTPTTDFRLFDGSEYISYTLPGGNPIHNVLAVRRPLTRSTGRRVEDFVSLEATDVVFHLDMSKLAGATLQASDTITALDRATNADVSYNVLFIERQTLGNTALAVCRRNP